ncbi:hypothetical protein ALC56_10730, partial [Trachymyrmex septentrionalis]
YHRYHPHACSVVRRHYYCRRGNVDESDPPFVDNRILPRHANARSQFAMPSQDSTCPICCASVTVAVRPVVFLAGSIDHNNSPALGRGGGNTGFCSYSITTVHGHCKRRDPTTWKTRIHSWLIPAIRIYLTRVHFSIQHKVWLHKYLSKKYNYIKKCIRTSRIIRNSGARLGCNIACLATPKLISTTNKSTTKYIIFLTIFPIMVTKGPTKIKNYHI